MARVRERDDGDISARSLELVEDGDAFVNGRPVVGGPEFPQRRHRQPLQVRQRVEAREGGLGEAARRFVCGEPPLRARRETLVEVRAALADRRSTGEGHQGRMRIDRGPGNDPACLTGAKEADLVRVDVRPRTECGDRTDDIGRQEVEVAAVAGAADPFGLADPALVVREHRDAGLDERPEDREVIGIRWASPAPWTQMSAGYRPEPSGR